MLAVISPAKTLDFESTCPPHKASECDYLASADELITLLRKKTRAQLAELMSISPALADLNYGRYSAWSLPLTEDNARAAIFAFKGDVYTGLTLDTYSSADLRFAQKHLRILSGLYGLLRPLDLMSPYRLEMGTALKTKQGKNLYEFWGGGSPRASMPRSPNRARRFLSIWPRRNTSKPSRRGGWRDAS